MFALLTQFIAAGIAVAAFSVIFNVPKEELFFCGICGGTSRVIFYAMTTHLSAPVWGTFFAALGVTAMARTLSYTRQAPSTLYHIAGILPLVPGNSLYQAMLAALNHDATTTYAQSGNVLKLAGVIGIGSIIVLSLPARLFMPPKRRSKS